MGERVLLPAAKFFSFSLYVVRGDETLHQLLPAEEVLGLWQVRARGSSLFLPPLEEGFVTGRLVGGGGLARSHNTASFQPGNSANFIPLSSW